MIASHFKVKNLWNGAEVVLNDTQTDPDNYFAIDTSPTSALDIRTSERNLAGRHGQKSYFSFYGGRALSFQGKIVAQSNREMDRMEQLLKKVFSLPSFPDPVNDGFVLIQWEDQAQDGWQLKAKVTADIAMREYLSLGRVRDFLIQLRAENPLIYSQNIITDDVQRYYQRGGFILPTILPAILDIEEVNKEVQIIGGNYDTPPIFTIHGPALNPRILHQEKDKFIKVNILLHANDVLVIDTEKGSVTLNGTVDASQYLDLESEWFYLSPGNNTILFTHELPTPNLSGTPSTEYVTVERRNAII